MKTNAAFMSQELVQLLCDAGAGDEKRALVLQYICEIEELIQQKQKAGEQFFWKDLPWIIQFWPAITFFFDDRDLVNFLNPCPELGGMSGFIGYSKKVLHDTFPSQYMPQTITFSQNPGIEKVLQKMKEERLSFPVFCKPDVGERAAGVKRISSSEELALYLEKFPTKKALIVQRPAGAHFPEKFEYGVQIVRDPKTDILRITSAELKSVPFVIGDGKHSVELLVKELPGLTNLQRENVLSDLSIDELSFVPPKDQKVVVVHAASVSRGTRMISLNMDFRDSPLEIALTKVLSKLNQFSSGRFDLVAASEEALARGEFEIIEGNPGAAIPLRVYRTDLSVTEVYIHLFKHFLLLRENAQKNAEKFKNNRVENFSPMTTAEIIWQLSKCLLQQPAQLKSLTSASTQKMLLHIRKSARPQRWRFAKSRSHQKITTLLERILDSRN